MAKQNNQSSRKVSLGTRKRGVHKKKRNKKDSYKQYKGQG